MAKQSILSGSSSWLRWPLHITLTPAHSLCVWQQKWHDRQACVVAAWVHKAKISLNYELVTGWRCKPAIPWANHSWKRLCELNALMNQTCCESHACCIPGHLLVKEGRMLSACRSDVQVSVSADGFNSHTLKRGSFAEVCHWKCPKAPNETFQKRMGFCALPIWEHSVFINLPGCCCSLCGDGTGMSPSQFLLVFRSPLIMQVPCREPHSSHAAWARLACESLRWQAFCSSACCSTPAVLWVLHGTESTCPQSCQPADTLFLMSQWASGNPANIFLFLRRFPSS